VMMHAAGEMTAPSTISCSCVCLLLATSELVSQGCSVLYGPPITGLPLWC
jgi:hypothetical protein